MIRLRFKLFLDAANIGRATFYTHFYDKDDLLCHSVALVFSSVYQQQASQYPEQLFPIRGILEHIAEHQALYAMLSRSQVFELMLRAVHTSLSQTINQQLSQISLAQPTLELSMVSEYLAGGCLSIIRWWLVQVPMPAVELIDGMIQQLVLPSLEQMMQPKT